MTDFLIPFGRCPVWYQRSLLLLGGLAEAPVQQVTRNRPRLLETQSGKKPGLKVRSCHTHLTIHWGHLLHSFHEAHLPTEPIQKKQILTLNCVSLFESSLGNGDKEAVFMQYTLSRSVDFSLESHSSQQMPPQFSSIVKPQLASLPCLLFYE